MKYRLEALVHPGLIVAMAVSMAMLGGAIAPAAFAAARQGGARTAASAAAATPAWAANDPLIQLAARKFPALTACELTVLHGAAAGADSSCAPSTSKNQDAGQREQLNDPARGAQWSSDREVRAALLRWLFLDRQARQYLDPAGVRIREARIPDLVDLHNFTIPVGLSINYSYLPRGMDLRGAKIPELSLLNSHSGPLRLGAIAVTHDLDIEEDAFSGAAHLTGLIDLTAAQIGGFLILGESRVPLGAAAGQTAVGAMGLSVRQNLSMWGLQTDGVVDLRNANINADLEIEYAKFIGAALTGLNAQDAVVKGALIWNKIATTPNTIFDVTGAKVGSLIDDDKSWPHPGKLYIDGFVYDRLTCDGDRTLPFTEFTDCRLNVAARLKWLGLQPSGVYYPQTYLQLAAILKARGDLSGARRVLIAGQNEQMRLGHLSLAQRLWGWLLWATIDYGYASYWALLWAALLVMIGGVMVRLGHDAGVMKPVEPVRKQAAPLVYSLDVFTPIVDLRLQRNWWPDPTASGTATLLGRKITVRGSMLRAYLWFHIVAGYILTVLFVAGLSGLVHSV